MLPIEEIPRFTPEQLRKFVRRSSKTICAELAYCSKAQLIQLFLSTNLSRNVKQEIVQVYETKRDLLKEIVTGKPPELVKSERWYIRNVAPKTIEPIQAKA